MSWTAPRTWANGEVPSASIMNTHIRDNINALVWQMNLVNTGETRANTAFGDLATVGPAVTITTGVTALVWVGSYQSNNTIDDGCAMSYAVSGATTTGASDNWSWFFNSAVTAGCQAIGGRMSRATLTAGSNTFTAKYRTQTGGTGTWIRRRLLVLAVN